VTARISTLALRTLANGAAPDIRLASPLMRRRQPPNRLLEALPRSQSQRMLEQCEAVDLKFGEILYQPYRRIRYAYFPADSFISLIIPVDGTGNLEVALVGNEGMLGLPLVLGVNVSPLRAMVQGKGLAWRMSGAAFTRELGQSVALRRGLHRYLQVRMCQLARAAACARFHLVEQRLARCLLMAQDRAHSNEFHATHELLAYMLGVRRVGVTKAASVLQTRQLIHYRRGEISILDRVGMEAAACGCYRADREAYDALLTAPGGWSAKPRDPRAQAR
jgi:CRP-like cAMP-binding protein